MEIFAALALSIIAAVVGSIASDGEPAAEYEAAERRAEQEANRRERAAGEFRRNAETMRAQAVNQRAAGAWYTADYLEQEAERQEQFAKEISHE